MGIAADGGRNAAIGEGLEADAVSRLLGCPVERSLGGFRCRERTILSGLEFSGRLDFSALPPGPVTVLMPASPLSDVAGFERQPAGWLVPVVACAAFTLLERRWDRLVADEAIRLGEQPAVLRQVLLAIRPEWGEAAVRVSERLPR